MTALEELAARVGALTGPDLEVDCLIWLACVPNATRHELRYTHKATGKECVIDETRENGRLIVVPGYSASIDAAIALVPEGYDWIVCQANGGLTIHACVGDMEMHFGNTPALALTAAALRARALGHPPPCDGLQPRRA